MRAHTLLSPTSNPRARLLTPVKLAGLALSGESAGLPNPGKGYIAVPTVNKHLH